MSSSHSLPLLPTGSAGQGNLGSFLSVMATPPLSAASIQNSMSNAADGLASDLLCLGLTGNSLSKQHNLSADLASFNQSHVSFVPYSDTFHASDAVHWPVEQGPSAFSAQPSQVDSTVNSMSDYLPQLGPGALIQGGQGIDSQQQMQQGGRTSPSALQFLDVGRGAQYSWDAVSSDHQLVALRSSCPQQQLHSLGQRGNANIAGYGVLPLNAGLGSSFVQNNIVLQNPLGANSPRNQGYRKLWQQVTKVSRGQKLDSNGSRPPETTVEDLIRTVIKLPPHESAVRAVEKGLCFLDSSATAALLKELAKQGHLKRSVEIFDWLRALPPTHELSLLCDLYTYTTMISQCKDGHQQLRRALELVAEMRSRGVECNVHTYSALMNVCIKANELDLAQDVYKQMLAEGCTPNLVTYNILIDVYVKKGQWEEAVRTLDVIDQQGIQAEVRTYNTVISACNKGGQPGQALKVYERLCAAGVKPSATTYTTLISAYGRTGQIEKALSIYQDMVQRGCERNVITYSSLIAACEKAGRWELALNLFTQMHQEGCKPNTVTYNSLIAACAHGGQWEKAAELFEAMPHNACKPDSITYCALVSAFEAGGEWRRALRAFEGMQASGCHPDATVFNSLMDVLWQSGVILAQVRALQLWSLANRQGQFRIYTNSRQENGTLQYSTVALTPGAAIVTVLRWLTELRSKLSKDGTAFFRERVTLTLHKSRVNKADQTCLNIQEAVSSMLLGAGSPFRVSLIDHTITVDSNSSDLVAWLTSNNFAELVYLVQCGAVRKVSLDVMLDEDDSVAARCMDAFLAVRRLETQNNLNVSAYQPAVLQQRSQVVHLASKYGSAFNFSPDTVYDGLCLFDKVMCCGSMFSPNLWPLCLCCCIIICSRQSEPQAAAAMATGLPWPAFDTIALLTGFGPDALSSMEHNIQTWLGGDCSAISALRVLQLYQERLGHYLADFKPADRVAKDLPALLLKVIGSPLSVGLLPSRIAAAVLIVLRRIKGMIPTWPSALTLMTGYSDKNPELSACVAHVERLLQE